MAKTLRPITPEEEGEINQILHEMETDSGSEPDIILEDFLCPEEIIDVIVPETPRSTLPEPPRPYSCCEQIICECTRNTPISYPFEDDEYPKNANGWGNEYYKNANWFDYDSRNDSWGLPESNEEHDLVSIWGDGISTIAWHYTPKELDDIAYSGFQ